MSSSKTIAKNTLFLYFRMFLIMGVTLYTSRVVLQQLGVSDFGIYSLVGGIVAMLGFFNAAMSSATQRYLSFDIGKGDFERLQKTFSATLTIHILIAVIALIMAETIGLWYINYKMVFPTDRLYAVNVVYQFSVLTFLLTIIQVPYNALIIAREKMKVYAYVSILEAILKLAIVFLLVLGQDKLQLYAILTFAVAFIIRLTYQVYCRKQFKESKYKFDYNKDYFRELLSYSGWNLFGNFAAVARGQGVNMVLNLFFGTVINAAYGVTMQVQMAVQLFINNFQMAFNPSIIKSYARGDVTQSVKLVYSTVRVSFFLALLIIVPIYLEIESIVFLWLGANVPSNAIVFIKLSLCFVLIESLSGPLMFIVQATGEIKKYQVVVGFIVFCNLPISYIVLTFLNIPESVFYVSLLLSLLSFVLRVFFVKKLVKEFSYRVLLRQTLLPICYVFFFSIVSILVFRGLQFRYSILFVNVILKSILVFLIVLGGILVFGFNKKERKKLYEIIQK